MEPLYPFIYDDMRATCESAVQQLVSDYEEMTDVNVPSKKCHGATRFRLILCEKCKKGYRSIAYEVRFSCYKEEKGRDKKEEVEDDWNSNN